MILPNLPGDEIITLIVERTVGLTRFKAERCFDAKSIDQCAVARGKILMDALDRLREKLKAEIENHQKGKLPLP